MTKNNQIKYFLVSCLYIYIDICVDSKFHTYKNDLKNRIKIIYLDHFWKKRRDHSDSHAIGQLYKAKTAILVDYS